MTKLSKWESNVGLFLGGKFKNINIGFSGEGD